MLKFLKERSECHLLSETRIVLIYTYPHTLTHSHTRTSSFGKKKRGLWFFEVSKCAYKTETLKGQKFTKLLQL